MQYYPNPLVLKLIVEDDIEKFQEFLSFKYPGD